VLELPLQRPLRALGVAPGQPRAAAWPGGRHTARPGSKAA
jgi:hypothetical protein